MDLKGTHTAFHGAHFLLRNLQVPRDKIKTLGAAAFNSKEAKQAQEMYEYIRKDVEEFKVRQ